MGISSLTYITCISFIFKFSQSGISTEVDDVAIDDDRSDGDDRSRHSSCGSGVSSPSPTPLSPSPSPRKKMSTASDDTHSIEVELVGNLFELPLLKEVVCPSCEK